VNITLGLSTTTTVRVISCAKSAICVRLLHV
jgi:hypothetical protein